MKILEDYAIQYESVYSQPIRPIFHTACSCVLAQQVSFKVGRTIRQELYQLCGFPLEKDKILNTNIIIKNLTPERLNLLKDLARINDNQNVIEVLNEYSKLKGFGVWSYGAVSILMGIDEHVNLYNDAYIRKNLSLYLGYKLLLNECKSFIATTNHETKVCYLLWRLKSTSIIKIKNNEILTKDDFI